MPGEVGLLVSNGADDGQVKGRVLLVPLLFS